MPASHSTLVWAGRGGGGAVVWVGRGEEGLWIVCTGSHLPLSHHDVTLGDVDTSKTVSRRLEEHSQTILQTCPAHNMFSISSHPRPAPPSHLPAPPCPTPHLPLSLDVALQVLVRVSRDWTQSMEFEGLCLCAPFGHCLNHLQGEERGQRLLGKYPS